MHAFNRYVGETEAIKAILRAYDSEFVREEEERRQLEVMRGGKAW